MVNELATRMVAKGHEVIYYDRTSKHVSGAALNIPKDTKDVKIVPVCTIDRKGLAALTSSFSAALKAGFSKADIVHIHAEGPAAMAWLPKANNSSTSNMARTSISTCNIGSNNGGK